ncbi:hypothetical protein J7E88_32245 [Streptomyces sp. ISL-10]|uniref:hypothetical protein n=1 Tax=Streptomyces sp. ISL-10 TaxID=2819172 RepID=UPI001BE528E3|nr:hypothetical protein [Streptomyces sp. ISL-10]MBT2369818.1 hypothetical protein [Streptomyces sp. ISL-10]
MPHQRRETETTARPKPPAFFELRIGSFHVTIQQAPYRLLALTTAVLGFLGGTTWFPH